MEGTEIQQRNDKHNEHTDTFAHTLFALATRCFSCVLTYLLPHSPPPVPLSASVSGQSVECGAQLIGADISHSAHISCLRNEGDSAGRLLIATTPDGLADTLPCGPWLAGSTKPTTVPQQLARHMGCSYPFRRYQGDNWKYQLLAAWAGVVHSCLQ